MDLSIDLTVSNAAIERLNREFRLIPGGIEKAAVMAINRTLPGVRTDAIKEVTQVYCIKAVDVRPTMSIRRASRNHIEGAVRSWGATIPLVRFRVNPNNVTSKRPKGGVRVTVRKGEGGHIRTGFIAAMGSGHTGVFVRKGKKRFPIEERFGPGVPSMLKDAGAHQRIQAKADGRLEKEIDRAMNAILKGYVR